MNKRLCQIIREMSQPQAPVPAGKTHKLEFLHNIKAVLFDIYGTLFTSGSGEIGVAPMPTDLDSDRSPLDAVSQEPLSVALGKVFSRFYAHSSWTNVASMNDQNKATRCGNEKDVHQCGDYLISSFQDNIREFHETKKQQGIPWPEVDVRKIWQKIIGEIQNVDQIKSSEIDQWAIEYEVRTNPVWPMPHATDCIDRLISANLTLGIISNAQFYTPLLFPALMHKHLDDFKISKEMQYYSYRSGRAKPDPWMFQQAAKTLAKKGITTGQTLYVGNDMRNDILPASLVGFRTALFAGDKRSLRLRENESSVVHVNPDIVATSLEEIADCVLK